MAGALGRRNTRTRTEPVDAFLLQSKHSDKFLKEQRLIKVHMSRVIPHPIININDFRFVVVKGGYTLPAPRTWFRVRACV